MLVGCEFGSEGFGREVTVEVDGFESLENGGRSSKLRLFIFMSVVKMRVLKVLGSERGRRVKVDGFESLEHGRGSGKMVVWKVMCLLWFLLLVFVGVGKV